MKQNKWHQPKWHRRWLSGLVLRQTKASLNLGLDTKPDRAVREERIAMPSNQVTILKCTRSTYTITADAHLGLVPAGAWIRCHNYRLLAP